MPQRHDLLRLRAEGWPAVLAATPAFRQLDEPARRLVARWPARGLPLIVRRRLPGEAAAEIPAGLPLPPAWGRLRLAFRIPAGLVAGRQGPVPLAEAEAAAPAAWSGQLRAVLALGAAFDTPPAVHGALLWQYLTGLPYLHPRSDLDLLWPACGSDRLPGLLAGLDRLDRDGPARLDGEILFPGAGGVAWRELHRALAAGGTVLVKGLEGASLQCVHTLLD